MSWSKLGPYITHNAIRPVQPEIQVSYASSREEDQLERSGQLISFKLQTNRFSNLKLTLTQGTSLEDIYQT